MSDPNERNALLAMMGTVFGEMKKIDQHIVGSSPQLRPKSDEVKTMFEGVLRNPVLPQPAPSVVSQPVQEFRIEPVVDQPLIGAANVVTLPHIIQPPQESKSIQVVDNSDLVSTLKGIENNLGRLVDLFTQYEVKIKKVSNRKVPRVNIESERPVHPESGEGQDNVDSELGGQHANPIQRSKPYE
jgi:hypothetical protein